MTVAKYQASQTREQSDRNICNKYYLITVVKNGSVFVPLSELDKKLVELKTALSKYKVEWSSFIGYEMKQTGVLHLHTIISAKCAPFIKPCKGWNIRRDEFPEEDYGRVVNYVMKDVKKYDGDKLQMETMSWVNLTPISSLYRESV